MPQSNAPGAPARRGAPLRFLIPIALIALALLSGLLLLLEGSRPSVVPALAESRVPAAPRPTEAELTLGPLEVAADEDAAPPVAARPESYPATIFGRVEDAHGGHPLADTAVEIRAPDGLSLGTRTDEEGRFALDYEGPMKARARALPRRGYVARDGWHELTSKERLGEKEVVLRLERGRSDTVAGMVLNRATGEGVFSLQVRVSGAGLHETCTTDPGGLFETNTAFPEGQVRVQLSDEAPEGTSHLGHFDRPHLAGGRLNPDWQIELDIGPSYLVLPSIGTELPPGSRVALREERPPGEFTTLLRYTPWSGALEAFNKQRREAGTAGGEEDTQWPWLTPRPGPVPWIRYARQVHPAAESTDPKLVLEDPSRQWRAEAPVPSTLGHHGEPIILALEPAATLLGVVADTTGEPVAEALVKLHRVSRADPTVLHLTETLENGRFELSGIDPGTYRVAISPKVHAGDQLEVRCVRGLNAIAPFLLPPVIDVGDVAGELYVAADMPHSLPFVTLASSEGSQWRKVIAAKSEEVVGGERRYSFRFEHVPGGHYEVSVGAVVLRGRGFQTDWTPRKRTVLPPHEGLVFRSKADGEGIPLFVNVHSEGKRLSAGTRLILGPGGMLVGEVDLMRMRRLKIPPAAQLEWTVVSPFHRSARGDERDLVFSADKAILDVELREGFSITFYLRGRTEESRTRQLTFDRAATWPIPIVGAKAYVNKKFVGRSDRDGRMRLDFTRPPAEIGILAPGWKDGLVQPYEDHDPILWLERDEQAPVR